MIKALTTVIALSVLLAGCGGGEGLRKFSATSVGPDEFSVLPTAPLQMPSDLTYLPVPTPGAANLVDPTPNADAIAALGGRAPAANAGVSASDAALVSTASRYGVPAGLRASLAEEDRAYRRTRGAFNPFGLFGNDRYFAAYAGQKLDAYAELQRLRRLGVDTPTAPPR